LNEVQKGEQQATFFYEKMPDIEEQYEELRMYVFNVSELTTLLEQSRIATAQLTNTDGETVQLTFIPKAERSSVMKQKNQSYKMERLG